MNDRVDFSIENISRVIGDLRGYNKENEQNKNSFLERISTLETQWNTSQGAVTIAELRAYADGSYQDFINYIDERINRLENEVLPAAIRMDRA